MRGAFSIDLDPNACDGYQRATAAMCRIRAGELPSIKRYWKGDLRMFAGSPIF